MKSTIMTLVLLLIPVSALAAPDWEWASSAGGTGHDFGYSIVTDSSGNSYITGYFLYTADFGTISLTSSGDDDIFVAKMDANGNWLWAKSAGGSSDPYGDRGYGISIDSSGNCYITGELWGTAHFGSTELVSSGNSDIFVAKLDTDGNWLWANRAGGMDADEGKSIATDSSGNCYVTGWFSGNTNFGSHLLISFGYSDVFIAKLDTNGNWLWATHAGSEWNDESCAIGTDSAGNCYVNGSFETTATFGATELISSGSKDVFVAKLDTNGNWLWANRAGGINIDEGLAIGIDGNGNCFATGFFYTTADFGSFILNSRGQGDIFIAKLDTNGNWLWANQAGGSSGTDYGYGISTDITGNCYVTGKFIGTGYFGTTSFVCNNNSYDIYVGSLDADGNWFWAIPAGGGFPSGDSGYGISTDSSGDCFLTGAYYRSADFGSITITGNGINEIFVAKLSNPISGINEILPTKIKLTNYPNPFNPQTTITFDLPGEQIVSLRVYDVVGRLLDILLNDEVVQEGRNEIVWRGRDESGRVVPAGVYFYRLEAGGFSETKRMTLVK